MSSAFKVLAVAALSVGCLAGRSDAATIEIDVDASAAGIQSTKTYTVGQTVVADIWITGLTESIGGFDIDLTFNVGGAAVLGFTSSTEDPDGSFSSSFSSSAGFLAPDTVNLGLAGDPAGGNLGPFPAAFRLGSIDLTALLLGNSVLTISYEDVTNLTGLSLLGNTTADALVCVAGSPTVPCVPTVPEPTALLLLSTGAAAFVARRRMRKTTSI